MKISRACNLIMPLERDGVTTYVHATPIPREAFERYFVVISKAFGAMMGMGGTGITTAPRTAALMLKKVAIELGDWEGPEGVEAGLMGEIKRLSNVLTLGANGWEMTPFSDAVAKGLFDAEDGDEVENGIVFFTLGSAIWHRRDRETMLVVSLSPWNAEISSQTCSDLLKSLPTSTETDNSGEKAPPSSIPS